MGDIYSFYGDRKCRYISRLSSDYPPKLQNIPDPPSGIYVKGRLPDPSSPAVAIIGSRLCSQYGRLAAQEFGAKLALAGVQVISGLARGIDGIAQDAACRAGGASFGILGCGVNVIYPARNSDIYERVLERGGLISEVPPSSPPRKPYFVQRNRLISGLCDILLVVEAKEKSGTQITVRRALEQGKDVFAIPGRINDVCSAGCNELIAAGAGIATSPDAVLNSLGIYPDHPEAFSLKAPQKSKAPGRLERQVLEALDYYPLPLSAICEKCHIPAPELVNILFHLQLDGLAMEQGKNFYIRTGGENVP